MGEDKKKHKKKTKVGEKKFPIPHCAGADNTLVQCTWQYIGIVVNNNQLDQIKQKRGTCIVA